MAKSATRALLSSTVRRSDFKMDVVSEQEVEAGSSYASNSGESGVGKGSFEAKAEADAYCTSAERGGWALVFESQRQNDESSEEVIALCNRLLSEGAAVNELGFVGVDELLFSEIACSCVAVLCNLHSQNRRWRERVVSWCNRSSPRIKVCQRQRKSYGRLCRATHMPY